MKIHRNRCGYTLMEMLAVLSVSATVLGVSIGWIHQSMKVASIIRERETHHRSLLRFSRQFRDDVHQAATVVHQPESQKLTLSLGDCQVSYTIRQQSLQRLELREAKVVAQEAYPLAETATARWLVEELPESVACVVIRGTRLSATSAGDTAGPVEQSVAIDSSKAGDEFPVIDDDSQRAVDLYVKVSPQRWDQIRDMVTSQQGATP